MNEPSNGPKPSTTGGFAFALVTASYWTFTLSDGALRMLVLLHLHAQGQTAWALALMLVPYEVAGVATNLLGGYLGARFGLKATLVAGLTLQVVACALLAVDAALLTVFYVMATQVLSGIAKDLAKTSAKSYVRVLAPDRPGSGLFALVALLTGSKNAIKGLGFFVGGALLAVVGFRTTNLALAALLALMAGLAMVLLPRQPGRPAVPLRSLFAHDASVNWFSLARLFLFGSRDAWFAVALPLFLIGQSWSSAAVGAFLAAWVIGYGLLQALAPRLSRPGNLGDGITATTWWTASLCLPLGATAWALHAGSSPLVSVLVGVCAYGALFAVTSSLHSWLIVALHEHERTPQRVGFYYAANALGRLAGLLLSGWLFGHSTFGDPVDGATGLQNCLLAAAAAVVLATISILPMRRALAA